MRGAVSCTKAHGDVSVGRTTRPALPTTTTRKNPAINAPVQGVNQVMAGTLAALGLSFATLMGSAAAGEFDILTEATPTTRYVVDDASVLSKNTKGILNTELKKLETETGYRLEVVTVRKLEYETDPFAFGDKVIEKWYPTVEEGTKKGILLVVTTSRDGALTGGPEFLKAVGDPLIDSVISNDIPILTEKEKFNQTTIDISKRVETVLRGQEDPGGPQRKDKTRKRTYRTKQETDKTRNVTSTLVGTLLFISFVVPMLQYYGYTSKD